MTISFRHVTSGKAIIVYGLTPEQKKFVDSVNGKSGLTYFDALESEVRNHMTFYRNTPLIIHTEQEHISDRDCIP